MRFAHVVRPGSSEPRLVVADAGWRTLGLGAEVLALAAERAFEALHCSPQRIALPDVPTPSTPRRSPSTPEPETSGRSPETGR